MENKTIFRDKTIERISSPDQLNDYIKLANPGVWFILLAILILLAGACIFGTVGHIDSYVPGVMISENNHSVCLVKKEFENRFSGDMFIRSNGREYKVSLSDAKPIALTPDFDSYALFTGNMQIGEWVYEVTVDGEIAEGIYEVQLVTEKISPLSFLFGKQ